VAFYSFAFDLILKANALASEILRENKIQKRLFYTAKAIYKMMQMAFRIKGVFFY
jgi:hypothetical protein